jgi:hypothetical protein
MVREVGISGDHGEAAHRSTFVLSVDPLLFSTAEAGSFDR